MRKKIKVIHIYIIITVYILLNIHSIHQCNGDNNTPMKYLHQEYKSPLGDIIVKHFSDYEKDVMNSEVWLYSVADPSKKAFLYSYLISARIIFSHDEKWLVLNNRYGSDGNEAILFKQVKGLKYELITSLDDLAWDFFKKTNRQYKIPIFDHSYTYAVQWSSDSRSVMLKTFGHDDLSPKTLEPWYCIYDVTTGKMSLDLNRVFNRDTYHPDGKATGRELYY
ncbi:MAG: hypothetical protein L7F77_06635 [Candidatus Magnetominusculus sp. LBB02]|nr:hypothetical protein [Candidatus Magnetominusculus sp. LBB02]